MKNPIKKYDRDIRFMVNTVACGLLFIAFLQAFGPYLGKPDPQQAEINAMIGRIVVIDADKVPPLLSRPDGKPVMMMVYASWCPACQRVLPDVADLIQHHKMDN